MLAERTDVLSRNLAGLSRSDPSLAARVAASAPAPGLRFLSARDGSVVPAFGTTDARVPMHSLFDPVKEARRVYETVQGAGFLVCFGLGGGFIPGAFVEDPDPLFLLVVEKDAATLRAIFENVSLDAVLSDPRVRFACGLGEIRAALASTFLPALCHDLRSLSVRPWCDSEKDFFNAAALEVQAAIEDIRSDFSVQAHFGKRWFSNMVLNLAWFSDSALGGAGCPARAEEAIVTAAGPSLELHVPELSRRATGSLLVATDTSLPSLLRCEVLPDVVVSLDCQIHSCRHFLAGMPEETCFFFDLASPPPLVRRARRRVRFYASAHPFSRYVAARSSGFLEIDTTGGNVTHAAVSLAAALGARRIVIHGADFSYPDGKPYARGSYLYDYFSERQGRCFPVEHAFFSFLRASTAVKRETSGSGPLYTTPVLLDYKSRLERMSETLGAQLVASEGRGLALQLSRARQIEMSSPMKKDEPRKGAAQASGREILEEYAGLISALPAPSRPLGRWLSRLTDKEWTLWSTLLPVAATVLRENPERGDPVFSLEESRQWAARRAARACASAAHA